MRSQPRWSAIEAAQGKLHLGGTTWQFVVDSDTYPFPVIFYNADISTTFIFYQCAIYKRDGSSHEIRHEKA